MRKATTGCLGIIGAAFLLAACSGGESPSVEAPPSGDDGGSVRPGASGTLSDDSADASARDVVAERLPYAEVDDKLVYGHFAIPADMIDPLPAVIVIHDRWGLNPEMQQITERLAAAGYIVLGVDLFDGKTADTPAGARELELGVVEDPDLAIDNLDGARDFIRNTAGAPSIAVVGYGFGGGWALTSALELSGKLDAAALYYGQVTEDKERLQAIDVPVLGLFAQGDRAVPVDSVERFESAMESLEKEIDVHIYEDARRSFADRRSDNYDPDTAADAWNRVLQFLALNLSDQAD